MILDASFAKAKHREAILDLANYCDEQVLCVRCAASLEVLERRLVERERSGGLVIARDGRIGQAL